MTVDGRRVDRALTGFYAVVAVVALAGQTGAARGWLGWPLLAAVAAVGAVEFGGIALSAYADYRRRLGERAVFARVLSAAVAAGAVAVNLFGHHEAFQGLFFAGMSALGYLVWLLHSGARRRDQLRAAGTLPPVPPVYGLAMWLRQPGLTRRARALALADPSLGLYGSLDAARAAQRAERRHAAIATALRRKITAAVDPLTAEIAANTFDLDRIAARLADGADYDGLTALIAADLSPKMLTGDQGSGEPPDDPKPEPSAEPHREPLAEPGVRPARSRVKARSLTAGQRVAKAHERHPEATHAKLAELAGVSLATVKRHRPTGSPSGQSPVQTPISAEPTERVNGAVAQLTIAS